jgi:hypothetical protein
MLITQICSDDKRVWNEMCGACITYGIKERGVKCFGWETCWKETTCETQAKMEYNIKMDLQEMEFGDIYWNELAQDKDRWQGLVNAVLNHHFPQNAGIS